MTFERAVRVWMSWMALLAMLVGTRVAYAEEPERAPVVLHDPVHERRAENGILRPVPLDILLPPAVDAVAHRVLVHYRLWGDPDWTAIELRRVGARHHGAIPCLEVSTITGDLRYYVRVHDAGGKVVATGASRAAPYVVSIRHETRLGAAEANVAKCPDPADCPRGLLGCPSERVIDVHCASDDDCEEGWSCGFRGICEKTERRRNFLGVTVSQELGALEVAGGCGVHAQEQEGYACFRADDSPYLGNPTYEPRPLAVAAGMTRIHAGYERLVTENATIGARVGWVVFGEARMARGAAPLVPVSVALRGTYAFGVDPFARHGFRPYLLATVGYGQFDVRASTTVREVPSAPSFQGGNDLVQRLAVHRRAGDAFIGAGAGVSYASSSRLVPSLELSVLDAFPFGAVLFAASASAMVAF